MRLSWASYTHSKWKDVLPSHLRPPMTLLLPVCGVSFSWEAGATKTELLRPENEEKGAAGLKLLRTPINLEICRWVR
jgi:hypothetical protein